MTCDCQRFLGSALRDTRTTAETAREEDGPVSPYGKPVPTMAVYPTYPTYSDPSMIGPPSPIFPTAYTEPRPGQPSAPVPIIVVQEPTGDGPAVNITQQPQSGMGAFLLLGALALLSA